MLKTDCHLRNKYRPVLLNGEAILLDINATERKRTAMPGTSDSAYLLLGRYFDVLLKTHEEQAHMFHC